MGGIVINLLTLNPISSCNLRCEHCPNKQWTYPIDDERNRLTNSMILKWMDKYLNPYEWFLEISGGEPGLYKGINELISTLNSMGYYGIIRTNGTLPIYKCENFIRLAGWHKQTTINNPPIYCDVMLITQNPDDCWREKAQYCHRNAIPYKCIPYKRFGDPTFVDKPNQYETKINTFFKHWTIVGSSGVQGYCYAHWGEDKDNIFNMSPPLMMSMGQSCLRCSGMVGLLDFMDDELRQKLAVRRDRYIFSKRLCEGR